jgi:hypothetical protein
VRGENRLATEFDAVGLRIGQPRAVRSRCIGAPASPPKAALEHQPLSSVEMTGFDGVGEEELYFGYDAFIGIAHMGAKERER